MAGATDVGRTVEQYGLTPLTRARMRLRFVGAAAQADGGAFI
jgi:hypothetical protein